MKETSPVPGFFVGVALVIICLMTGWRYKTYQQDVAAKQYNDSLYRAYDSTVEVYDACFSQTQKKYDTLLDKPIQNINTFDSLSHIYDSVLIACMDSTFRYGMKGIDIKYKRS